MRLILVIVLYLIFAGLLYLSSYLLNKDKSFLFSGCNFLILAYLAVLYFSGSNKNKLPFTRALTALLFFIVIYIKGNPAKFSSLLSEVPIYISGQVIVVFIATLLTISKYSHKQ